MRPRSVGIREAKAELSRLVADAATGTEWIITDRGRPVARLTSIDGADEPLEVRLERLRRRGVLGPPPAPGALMPVPPDGPRDVGLRAQEILQEDRDAT